MITQIEPQRCTGCELCVLGCPMEVILFDDDKRVAYFTNPNECLVCHNCIRLCPEGAITVTPEKPVPYPGLT